MGITHGLDPADMPKTLLAGKDAFYYSVWIKATRGNILEIRTAVTA
ncbi:hypothetical protein [Anaplasma bovis]